MTPLLLLYCDASTRVAKQLGLYVIDNGKAAQELRGQRLSAFGRRCAAMGPRGPFRNPHQRAANVKNTSALSLLQARAGSRRWSGGNMVLALNQAARIVSRRYVTEPYVSR